MWVCVTLITPYLLHIRGMRLSPAPALDPSLAGSLVLLHLAVVAGGLALLSSASVSVSASGLESVRCRLQATPRPPAFSQDGDFVIGGVFSIHNYMHTVDHRYTRLPEPLQCTGRSVSARGNRGQDCGCGETDKLCFKETETHCLKTDKQSV
jgi:hypothetical protein